MLALYLFLFAALSSEGASPPISVLILGDSLTAGYGVSREESYPVLLQNRFKKAGRAVEVVGAGVSGATSASAISRLRWHLKKKPDWLLLALGANDGLRGIAPGETEKNLLEAGKMAAKAGIKVIVLGMKAPPNYGKEFSAQHEKVYASVAKTLKAPLLPFLLEGVAGVSALNQGDGIHPTAKGHEKIADHVYPFLASKIGVGK